jgi:type VI secretion system secreted protein VgrG
MSVDVFSIHCDALQGATLVGFKGTEVLCRPFEMELFFTIPVGSAVKAAIGARASLVADRDDGRGPMCWHGILVSVRLLHETAERALYRAALVPRLWLLRRHVRSFVHTRKSVDTFLADTFKDGGLTGGDFQIQTAGAYPVEEFVCQYRESHLDFVHRWLEREGLYYYFEHPAEPGATERVIVVDDKAHHHPLLGEGHVRYFPAAGHDGSAGECLRELHADFEMLPASVLISDYNYANPAVSVAGEEAVSQAGQGKIREYGYRVFTEAEARRLAQVKAQSMACRELVLTASGDYLGLRAGYTLKVEEGPGDLPAEHLAVEVRHAGAVSGAAPMVRRYTGLDARETYRVDVVAIPASVQYRAPQTTSWPRIYGFENGTVDGPGESQYAQIDDQGRYLVRFKFDVSDLPDGSTSTYLRMMQPHGGTTEGWHFPLRKGTEVMVSFQGGDPDRPVIAGVVPKRGAAEQRDGEEPHAKRAPDGGQQLPGHGRH